jgi:O-antigen/teichoic acid export membrane protein
MGENMSSPAAEDQADASSTRRPHFLANVLWSWGGVALNIFVGVFISRFLIRRLDDNRYGIWVLVTSLIDYLWFFDLGFNTAVTNFLARFRARNEPEKINVVMNTAMLYFSAVSAILISIAVFASQHVDLMFPKTSAQDRHDIAALFLITGISYGLFQMVHIFTSALDGFQRFDLTTRSYATMLFFRSAGIIIVLSMGYGLRALGGVYMAGQAIGYAMNVMSFRRVFPELHVAPWRFASRPMLKDMVRYGIPSFGVNVSNLVLGQSATILIGRYRGMSAAGYYALPSRILQYLVDAVSRVALVTRSNAAEREASGQKESVWKLGVFSNRYCFILFAPLALYLLVYGHDLVLIWLKQSFADNSAPILYILVPAIWIVMAGQYNSSAILFGLGTHNQYAQALMVEAAANVAGMIYVIPRYGIIGAACVASGLMLLIRGIYTPYLLCKSLDGSLWRFLYEIYVMPLLIGVPAIAVAILLKNTWLPGSNFGQLVLAGGIVAATYFGLAMFTCVDREHRVMLIEALRRRIAARRAG